MATLFALLAKFVGTVHEERISRICCLFLLADKIMERV